MNQIAQKLNNELKFSAILPDDLFKVWQNIKKYLERSCKRSKDNKCHGIEAMGRKGFSHWSTKKNEAWQESHVYFEMKFEEKK